MPKNHKSLSRYLVVSYDDDQQQWFYDFVLARDPKAAKGFVEDNRPYVIAADAIGAVELRNMGNNLQTVSEQFIRDGMIRLIEQNKERI